MLRPILCTLRASLKLQCSIRNDCLKLRLALGLNEQSFLNARNITGFTSALHVEKSRFGFLKRNQLIFSDPKFTVIRNSWSRQFSDMAENRYACDYAKVGTASCKKCKQKLTKGSLRIAKVVTNPFNDSGGDMKMYHHPNCIFETFVRAKATTKIIEELEDIENHDQLTDDDKKMIQGLIEEIRAKRGSPKKATPRKATPKKAENAAATPTPKPSPSTPVAPSPSPSFSLAADVDPVQAEKDNSFREFRRLCANIADESSYTGKTRIVSDFIKKGSSGTKFHGDIYLLLKLLLPGFVKTVYNMNSKQIAKIFSQVFGMSAKEMTDDLEQGDPAETVKTFFENSTKCPPQKKSTISIQEVDALLAELSKFTKEEDQQAVLTKIARKCTANDLKMVVRLIKHDLRINAGAKHILEGLDPNAYEAFQASRDLKDVVERVLDLKNGSDKPGMKKSLSVRASLLTPILPMLAEACKSVEMAFKKCPNGMYAEVKYDGERVQVHKQGDNFSYFSRSLKPVLPHKVNHFQEFIPQAFPKGGDLILDAEVLLIDTNTSKPLPFGSLGVHKKQAFKDAKVCLFVFDCIHYNGENLLQKPIKERRRILKEKMVEIPNRILLSEMTHITKPDQLKDKIMEVLKLGLEGLVLKDVMSIYEPGKRHWLKVKKDYLAEGAMADSADLVVLGAYFGEGKKGGLMSIFLMGVYNPDTYQWCTVTKCHSGFDDATLAKLQKDFAGKMVKIGKDYDKVPKWLNMNRGLAPDFVVKDPKDSVVWEITGAEFTKAEIHTADGISIRFPRCTKMRDDKTWKEATDLRELHVLFDKSKEYSELPDLLGGSPSKGGRFKKKTPVAIMEENNSAKSSPGDTKSPIPKAGPSGKDRTEVAKASFGQSPQKRSISESFASPVKKQKLDGGSVAASSDADLPNIFSGMKFHVSDKIDDAEKLKRYIIAYDGDVVSTFDSKSATHVVVSDSTNIKDKKRDVTIKWVRRCIKKQRIVSK